MLSKRYGSSAGSKNPSTGLFRAKGLAWEGLETLFWGWGVEITQTSELGRVSELRGDVGVTEGEHLTGQKPSCFSHLLVAGALPSPGSLCSRCPSCGARLVPLAGDAVQASRVCHSLASCSRLDQPSLSKPAFSWLGEHVQGHGMCSRSLFLVRRVQPLCVQSSVLCTFCFTEICISRRPSV